MMHILGRMELDYTRFHNGTQKGTQLKTETLESKTRDKRALLYIVFSPYTQDTNNLKSIDNSIMKSKIICSGFLKPNHYSRITSKIFSF